MSDKITAQYKISELVNRFEEQYTSYKGPGYNETLTRHDFIDPFFKALGWDINNENGSAEAYREVIHEDKMMIEGATKAPDYSFKLPGGKRLFFVEAKKPSVSVKDDIHPAYQIRRYGWSAKHPISIITDFEEFSIYDCSVKPIPTDKPSTARIKYLTYRDYSREFDFIWETFSKSQVLKGSFDKFIKSDTNKKGTASVDKEFLQSLDSWRTRLAINISWNNKKLDEDEINFAVQQIIDRLIFLRIAEDRHVEPYGNLKQALTYGTFYQNLLNQFQRADEKYNSGLFDFKKDRISQTLIVENKVLKVIINELYYPECPYEFSVIPVEILGSAYEQFLGKVIRITPSHHAKIEEKPEVRKAGGVYYTPQYIVEYIVKNTVGKIIEGKTPKEISKIKIVDPACGSGSFLIGAYQYLLDWHKNYYSNDVKKSRGNKDYPLTPAGYLTTSEKKKILINNIFGVDLDVNAVEVTKLSLLLKCLEGETETSINQQFKLFNERVLPTLDDNIKSGNSIISPEIYDIELDFGAEKKIKPFNWKLAFQDIIGNGGFNIVIGNPPWGAALSDIELGFLKAKHSSIIVRMVDSYMYFINHAINLLKPGGYFGMIIPSTFLNQSDMSLLRRKIINTQNLHLIINLGEKIFGPKVLNTSSIIVFEKSEREEGNLIVGDIRFLKPELKKKALSDLEPVQRNVWRNIVKSDPQYTFFTLNISNVLLFNKLKAKLQPFKDILVGEIQRGISPDYTKAFIVSSTEAKLKGLEESKLRPVALGKHISRYHEIYSDDFIIYLNSTDNINNYPNLKSHLEGYKSFITCREVAEGKHPWYALHRPRDPSIFIGKKFIGLTTTKKLTISIDNVDYYITDALYTFKINNEINEKIVLAVLHSKLFQFLYNTVIQGGQRVIPQVKAVFLNGIPFPIDQVKDNTDKVHCEIVKLVDDITRYNKDKSSAKLLSQVEQINVMINYLEQKIDQCVYNLYELNDDEILMIEESF